MEKSKQFERYLPTDTHPIYVFKNNILKTKITTPIATIGFYDWNTIVSHPGSCTSRVHAILVFVKNKNNDLIMMIIDGWSLYGTYIVDKNDRIVDSSKNSERKILLPIINCTKVYFASDSYTFLFSLGKTCIICMDNDRNIRFKCGHGVTCSTCSVSIKNCPICREDISNENLEVSQCFETYAQH